MKKVITTSFVVCASLLLTACGKEGAFKSAINDGIKSNYTCLKVSSGPIFGVPFLPYEDYEGYRKASTALIVKMKEDGKWVNDYSGYDKGLEKQLDTLITAGLLTKKEAIQPAIGYANRPIDGQMMIIELYNLTDAGKDTLREDAFMGDKKPFCFTHTEVDKIISYQESKLFGHNVVQVKYSYKYVDVAQWAKNKDIQATFPAIDTTLNDKDKTDTITLVETKKGWRPAM